MTYSNHGGERWHLSFGNNGTSMNFVLDTYVYMVNPSQVQNLEIDLNQVMSNGETVIYGTQCSSISKTWVRIHFRQLTSLEVFKHWLQSVDLVRKDLAPHPSWLSPQ